MVSAQKAGVMFTSNPITNDYDTVVLEAAWGLGEAIVSGMVTPDNLWIDKHTGEVTTEYISERRPWWSGLASGAVLRRSLCLRISGRLPS